MDRGLRMRYMQRIERKLNGLPWYVAEFIETKKRSFAPTTLLNYCHDYLIFFDWLAGQEASGASSDEIALDTLEALTVRKAEQFLQHLEYTLGNHKLTVNRKLSSLKSLFDYLQNIAETRELKPYIQRNVMAKMDLNAVKESPETLAKSIDGKILRETEFEAFRRFVMHGFGERHAHESRIRKFHLLNRERDTAIVSLILGSGLRLSEVAGIDLEDVDLERAYVRVTRKGNKKQYVYFSKQALADLHQYLRVRDARYRPKSRERCLFVAAAIGRKGDSRRLTARAIEKRIQQYAAAYGKPSLTVHALRHSFATRYHLENNDVPKLKNQLGHASIQTTMIYTHLRDEEMRHAVDRMDW
ncbi:tyrosine recombinase XerS [Paenibacillus sp. IB182496]|uniref:Tyrosine recombinase XerS n=1 Tax=Paenibacillus sabuli TaxID=2772509 RepID=A0A927GRF6_9BACL|nr:tyrosine recombinase XerS [Paenibacillus sabuli]MBD2845433.1 tyrosine recombinase XerS [Paenibacillus sabuli]